MADILRRGWLDDDGQDIAEYAVMLAVILVIVVGSNTPHRLERQQRLLRSVELASVISTQAHKPHRLRTQVCPPMTRIWRDLVPDFSGGLGRGF